MRLARCGTRVIARGPGGGACRRLATPRRSHLISLAPPPPHTPFTLSKLSELRKGERAALLDALTSYSLPVTGHEASAR